MPCDLVFRRRFQTTLTHREHAALPFAPGTVAALIARRDRASIHQVKCVVCPWPIRCLTPPRRSRSVPVPGDDPHGSWWNRCVRERAPTLLVCETTRRHTAERPAAAVRFSCAMFLYKYNIRMRLYFFQVTDAPKLTCPVDRPRRFAPQARPPGVRDVDRRRVPFASRGAC